MRYIFLSLLFIVSLDGLSAVVPEQSGEFRDVNEGGFRAHLYLPAGHGPFPVLIAIGGSEGGFITGDAFGRMFVSEGIAVLGVAYFGVEGLPPAIDRIPIEYFESAIDYLEQQSVIDSRRIAIVGGSKGSELTLLLSSMDSRIRAVCALVPSNVVWQSARLLNRPTSSWTWHGQPLPFVPYKGDIMPATKRIADLFELSLQNRTAVDAAYIPVEKINGPILLISATHDEIWPSKLMSEQIVRRLAEKRYSFGVEHLNYDTGHGFSAELAPEVNAKIIAFFKRQLLD